MSIGLCVPGPSPEEPVAESASPVLSSVKSAIYWPMAGTQDATHSSIIHFHSEWSEWRASGKEADSLVEVDVYELVGEVENGARLAVMDRGSVKGARPAWGNSICL